LGVLAMSLLGLAACSSLERPHGLSMTVKHLFTDADAAQLVGKPMELAGVAQNGREGALLVSGDQFVVLSGMRYWTADQLGRLATVAGTLAVYDQRPMPGSPEGPRRIWALESPVVRSVR
jgi:hypothetical protein